MNQGSPSKPETLQGNRHRSRILALQTLYACEVGKADEWRTMLDRIADGSCLSYIIKKYAVELLTNLFSTTDLIDELICKRASNWDIKRMAVIDRNILRLAATELKLFQSVPAKVVIDEAVELAKSFGTEESGKFVNGIIDSIHKSMIETTSVSGKEGSLHGTDTCPK